MKARQPFDVSRQQRVVSVGREPGEMGHGGDHAINRSSMYTSRRFRSSAKSLVDVYMRESRL